MVLKDVEPHFDPEVKDLVNGSCPKCGGNKIAFTNKFHRNGKSLGVFCHECGYGKELVSLKEHVEDNTSMLRVIINNKNTNLVVDEFSYDEQYLYLTAHPKPLDFCDLFDEVLDEDNRHVKRLHNKITKLFYTEFDSDLVAIHKISVDNGMLMLLLLPFTRDKVNDYMRDVETVRGMVCRAFNISENFVYVLTLNNVTLETLVQVNVQLLNTPNWKTVGTL